MSYIYLLEGEEAFSAECFAEIPACAPWKSGIIQSESCCKGSATESCRNFRSGTMCGHSTESRGGARPMSSAADSRARTSLRQTETQSESGESIAAYGGKWRESSGRSNPRMSSSRTRRALKCSDSNGCFKTSTASDTTRAASNLELKISAKRFEKGFGYWGRRSGKPDNAQNAGIGHIEYELRDNYKFGSSPFFGIVRASPPAGVCGMGDGVPHRVDRFAAVGNAQNPVVAALAFEILMRSFHCPEIEGTGFPEIFRDAA